MRGKDLKTDLKNETINQIKNISQNKKIKHEAKKEFKAESMIFINSFDHLLKICNEKKEMKLKYELEKNVNLVSFVNNRIEISFNDNLDKNFVKDLSSKLFDWTGERWIITFSKSKGDETFEKKEKNKKKEKIENIRNSELYKKVLEKFPDANLIDVKKKNSDKMTDFSKF